MSQFYSSVYNTNEQPSQPSFNLEYDFDELLAPTYNQIEEPSAYRLEYRLDDLRESAQGEYQDSSSTEYITPIEDTWQTETELNQLTSQDYFTLNDRTSNNQLTQQLTESTEWICLRNTIDRSEEKLQEERISYQLGGRSGKEGLPWVLNPYNGSHQSNSLTRDRKPEKAVVSKFKAMENLLCYQTAWNKIAANTAQMQTAFTKLYEAKQFQCPSEVEHALKRRIQLEQRKLFHIYRSTAKQRSSPKLVFSDETFSFLLHCFEMNPRPSKESLIDIAHETGLQISQVRTWVSVMICL